MLHALPRRALAQLALVGFAVCFNATLATPSQAQAGAGEAAPPAPAAALDPGAVAAEADQPPDDAEAGSQSESPLVTHQRKTLQTSLAEVNKDRQGVSTVLPWVVTGIGAGMIIVSLILGVESSIGCGDSCEGGSAAPAWLAVFGTTISTAGLVWTLNTERDIDRIESREYRIKTELERLDWHTAPRQQSTVSPRLSLRGSF